MDMEVVLMRYTLRPEDLCTQAMMGTRSTKAAFEIEPTVEQDKRMIALAIEKGHESVLEHVVWTFSVKGVSRVLTHQLVRHRIASYSQQSQRHVNPTKNNDWYIVPKTLKEVYSEETVTMKEYHKLMRAIAKFYQHLINCAIPEEDARFVLPNACKTNIVITMNTRELRHFFKLRLAQNAQWEIRAMAHEMFMLANKIAPTLFEGFEKAV